MIPFYEIGDEVVIVNLAMNWVSGKRIVEEIHIDDEGDIYYRVDGIENYFEESLLVFYDPSFDDDDYIFEAELDIIFRDKEMFESVSNIAIENATKEDVPDEMTTEQKIDAMLDLYNMAIYLHKTIGDEKWLSLANDIISMLKKGEFFDNFDNIISVVEIKGENDE